MIKKLSKRSTAAKDKKQLNPGLLPDLIRAQDWKNVRQLLSVFPNEVKHFLNSSESESEPSENETMMNLCCRYHPPFDVLKSLYDCQPKSIFQADEMGRFPLHTACRCGTSLAVVTFLIQYSSELIVTAQDKMGRTPLHICSEHYLKQYDPRLGGAGNISGRDALLEIVKSLAAKSPDIVNMEDDREQTALELAIEFAAPLKVVKKLQKLCEKDWKARRSDQDSHEDMRKQFHSQVSSKRKILEQDPLSIALALSEVELNEKKDDCQPKGDNGASFHPRPGLLAGRRKPISSGANAA